MMEDFIRKNRKTFDIEEPPTEVWNKIQKEVFEKEPKSKLYLWKAAAVTFLISTASLLIYRFYQSQEVKSLSDISPEYAEMETLYRAQLTQLESELDSSQFNNKRIKWLFEEIDALDDINKSFENDLKEGVINDRLINNLLDYYEKKIRLLERIKVEINRINHESEILS